MNKTLNSLCAIGCLFGLASHAQAVTLEDLINGTPMSLTQGNLVFSNFSASETSGLPGGTSSPQDFSYISVTTGVSSGETFVNFFPGSGWDGITTPQDFSVRFDVTATGGVLINDAAVTITGGDTNSTGPSEAHVSEVLTSGITPVSAPLTYSTLTGPGINDPAVFPGVSSLGADKDLALNGTPGDNLNVSDLTNFFSTTTIVVTPEPGVVAMFVGMGMGSLLTLRRRRK